MLTEEDCRELHIPLTPKWTLRNSPLVSMHDREIGGLTTIFLGEPGAGKTRASYLRAWRMFGRERLFVRGLTKNHIWHWRFGKRAVVWVPESTSFKLFEAEEYGGKEIAVHVETYHDFPDLLSRAKVGSANVMYWGSKGADHWGEFLQSLLQRKDRLPQLILDDEVQSVAPQGATNADGSYLRVRGIQGWMREARESEVSSLFSTQIDYQMDYNVGQLAHFYVFLAGSRIPDRVLGALPRRPGGQLTRLRTSGLPPGDGFVVGRTPDGYRYQPVRFKDKLKVRSKTVSVVVGPPEPDSPTMVDKMAELQERRDNTRVERREEVQRLKAQGYTQTEVAAIMGCGLRTVQRVWYTSPIEIEVRRSANPPRQQGG